jgi:hypothetical protein
MNDRLRFLMLSVSACFIVSISLGAGTTVAEPDADRLLTKAVHSLETEPVQAVNVQEISRPGRDVTQRIAIHKEATNKGYLEILDGTGDGVEQLVVVDGSTVWRQEQETTIRYNNSNREWLQEYRSIGASPTVIADHFEGQYRGTTTLAGREVHVVAVTPPDETTATLSLDIDAGNVDYEIPIHEASDREWYLARETWWIDTETYYPIKRSVEWTDESGTVIATATQEYEQLVLNPGMESGTGAETLISSGTYEMPTRIEDIDTFGGINPSTNSSSTNPPSTNESVNDSETTSSIILEPAVFQTQTAANDSVPFDIPSITPPNGYLFDRATVYSYNNTDTATLLYPDQQSGVTLTIQVSNGPSSPMRSEETIYEQNLTNADGRLVVTDRTTQVVHQCGTYTVRISGPPSIETLIEITRSLECHG